MKKASISSTKAASKHGIDQQHESSVEARHQSSADAAQNSIKGMRNSIKVMPKQYERKEILQYGIVKQKETG